MKFDVIIGNPPYQLSDGGNGASAGLIFQNFVEQSIKLNPQYLCMIIPARWYSGGKGLDSFRSMMIKNRHIKEIHDFVNGKDCFPSVEVKGGICYFLWERNYNGDCLFVEHSQDKVKSIVKRPISENGEVVIRYNDAISIVRKVRNFKERSFSEIMSARKPFGFATNYFDFNNSEFGNAVKIYAQKKIGYIDRKAVKVNPDWIDKYKLFIPKANGNGDMSRDWIKPIKGESKTCCTETYLLCGPFDSELEMENAYNYTQTKFFHLLLGLKKITQDTTSKVYEFIPVQDFSESWTDEKLYEKYGLTEEEIAFIDNMIRPMD